MPKNKPDTLSNVGLLINELGLALPFVIEKSGIVRSRLVYLRTNPKAVLSFDEAQALAPVFKMTVDELAEKLKELRKTGGDAKAGKE